MTKKPRTAYMTKYQKAKYDAVHLVLQKGESEILKKAALYEEKSLNAFVTELAMNEAKRLLSERMLNLRQMQEEAVPADDCAMPNALFYIEVAKSIYCPEPLRLIIINIETGEVRYRKEFTTVYSPVEKEFQNAFHPNQTDFEKIKGYLNSESIFTYDLERLFALTDAWGIELPGRNIREFGNGKPFEETIGLDGSEHETGTFELAEKLVNYVRNSL